MNNDNQSQSQEGLPDIAQDDKARHRVVLIILGIIIIVVFGLYGYVKPSKKLVRPMEETYTVQVEPAKIENKNEGSVPAKPHVEKQPEPKVNPEVIQQQMALIIEKQKELQQRLSAPLMIVNANTPTTSTQSVQQVAPSVSHDANTQFMQQVSAQNPETTHATTIGPLNYVIAEGSLIHAILESAVNSDLPGSIRASVNEPVYSEDGTRVLIPPGSRLIGQYKSGLLQGQSRIFVVWTRLITPSGLSVQLGSPGVDNLGVAGMGADEINRHFWQRFGTSSLLSLIGAGAANAGANGETQDNSVAMYRAAVASSFAQSADQTLQRDIAIAPTLKKYQGQPITVFVAKDINFQSAMKESMPKLRVF